MRLLCMLLLCMALISNAFAQSQKPKVDETAFFSENSLLEVKIITSQKMARMKDGQKYQAFF